jgi:uncharacterized protein (TIGR00255 family)
MGALHSMTGYAAGSTVLSGIALCLELRSVNSRFLDLNFRLPDELRAAEPALRELLTGALSRGKVDCRATLASDAGLRTAAINADALSTLKTVLAEIREHFPDASPASAGELLRWPGLFGNSGPDPAACLSALKTLAADCVEELAATRRREGAQMALALRERLAAMRAILARIAPLIPAAQAAFEARVRQRLVDALGSADDERIRQEVVVFATRVDVAEEISRLFAHIEETERVIAQGGAVGKRLDFLMQEFNREANTLGSKSVSGEVSAAAMELKILIEQMREQVQNIE